MKQINVFKIAIVLILAGFLYVAWDYANETKDKGRYILHNASPHYIIDTKTGRVYSYKEKDGDSPSSYEAVQEYKLP